MIYEADISVCDQHKILNITETIRRIIICRRRRRLDLKWAPAETQNFLFDKFDLLLNPACCHYKKCFCLPR